MPFVPTQPERDVVMGDLIDALRLFTVESDIFVDVFARAHGLGRSDLNAIMWITTGSSTGAPLTVGELAQRLGLSPAAATALVDRLETAGHVGRTRELADRRRVTLHMQARALELATAFFVPLGKLMREAAADLSDGDLARATSVIRQMAAAVTKAREQTSG